MSKKAWKDYTPEQKAKSVAQHRRAKYLRDTGRPQRIPAGPAQRKLLLLRDVYSMSFRDIAKGCGLAQSTVSDLARGRRVPTKGAADIATVPRRTHDLIMAYTPDATFYNPDARVPMIGTQRRLQALTRAGYASTLIADLLGRSDWNRTWALTRGLTRAGGEMEGYVYAKTRDTIKGLFDKYVDVDPLDVGGTRLAMSRCARISDKYGYAPAACWDDDTIEDPDAIPEWTGMCGTEEGWITHHVRDVPMCEPCKAAVTFNPHSRTRERLGEIQARYEYDPRAMANAMYARQLSGNQLEMDMGLTKGIVSRWLREGEANPSWKSGLRICDHLDLPWTDMFKRKATS